MVEQLFQELAALPAVAKWGAGMVSPILGDRALIFKIMAVFS